MLLHYNGFFIFAATNKTFTRLLLHDNVNAMTARRPY